jgi:NAD+ kinase
MNIGLHGKKFDTASVPIIRQVLDDLAVRQVEVHISDRFCRFLKAGKIDHPFAATYKPGQDLSFLDCMITLGGDGTLLEVVTHIGKAETPILGINTGRLGFLATTSRDEISSALQKFFDKAYTIDARTLLRLETDKDELFDGITYALNDFTIMKKDTSSMIVVHTYIDGKFLNSYWADGLIVATPTGSTGYSLSCGGPLVLPQSKNFILTPVSPHNLTARPMVVSDDCELTFEVEGRSKYFMLSLDSRFATIDDSVRLKISRERFKAQLVKLEGFDIFDTLRQKLNWGVDARN